jgi:uncharacterized protein
MSDHTLNRIFECVFSSPYLSDALTILWHAGEPLVLGTEYYEHAFTILESYRPPVLPIRHNFQTNGMLITQAWATFFQQADVTVGVSIDGPKVLHDRFRKTRRHNGTFDQAMRGIRILQDQRVPFHAITVLTRESLCRPLELFRFYVENGITRIGFNIEEIEGNNKGSSLQVEGIEEEMRCFFQELYSLCESHPGQLSVREFDAAFHAIVEPAAVTYGNPLAEPMRMLSVGVNGELSTFSPELLGYSSERYGPFEFGNIHHNGLDNILHNEAFVAANSDIERGLRQCELTCEYFDICRGGAPVNKLFENGTFDSTETLFCRLAKKAVIDVVLDRLERRCYAS